MKGDGLKYEKKNNFGNIAYALYACFNVAGNGVGGTDKQHNNDW